MRCKINDKTARISTLEMRCCTHTSLIISLCPHSYWLNVDWFAMFQVSSERSQPHVKRASTCLVKYPIIWLAKHLSDAWRSMVKSGAGNVIEAEIWILIMVIQVFVAMKNLFGDSWLVAVVSTTQEKFKVLPFRIKNQDLTFIDCVWQWPYWKHCFHS
jgi:hypothetical protein